MDEDNPVEEMTVEECWDMLAENELGRIAFHLGPEVHITPVNYGVRQQTLLFRTAPGSKLIGCVMNPDVAFEIDQHDEHSASSVVIRGRARRLEEAEQHRTEEVRLHPWVPTEKYEVVEIQPEQISGRRFYLHRPWLHMLPE